MLARIVKKDHIKYSGCNGTPHFKFLDPPLERETGALDGQYIPPLHNCTTTEGPGFGYVPNPSKTWLVTKDGHCEEASSIFAGSGVNITSDGRPYLGVAIGFQEFVEGYVRSKVQAWSADLSHLSKIALSPPLHTAY